MTDLRTLVIYGASDDLVEVEGYIEDEFGAYGPTTLLVTDPHGARLAVTAEFGGNGPLANYGSGWVLTVHHTDPAWTHPVRLEERLGYDGDPAIVLEVPAGTTVTKWEEKR